MFLNIRLPTVASFASIVALHCELDVIDAFAGSLGPLALQHPLADHCA